ncbi:putative dual specificity tyrosine-phosphorylation-regulated kinase 3 homolog isoform X3 [Clinocottus analis]|uniref:putative dual specificity tyrosine-phosphorylation-regulated kinase 3 homolog isoform X3 n=1 Tax=Clinocottus analis TaxID=304258 RepID=UPI0035BF8675
MCKVDPMSGSRDMRRTHLRAEVQTWDMLQGELGVWELQYQLFAGCFSNVAKYKNAKTKISVAIKIFKKRATGSFGSKKELAMLKKIRGLDPENTVWLYEDFEHKGHTCLAFEMLSKNLHEFLKEKHGNRLSLREIRTIAQQLLNGLQSLKAAGVIHANIKPQNIMLKREMPLNVQLIGFGCAIAAAEVQRGVIMQPVAYRSPDVILGLPISEAVDMWSLGAVLATMFLGSLPFPQRCQYYQVKTMVETLGELEDSLLSEGVHTQLYFSPNQDSTTPAWRLKTVEEYKAATGFPAQKHIGSSSRFNCLHDLEMLIPEEYFENKIVFVHLLRAMLCMNPQKRILASVALQHPFITQTLYVGEVISPVAAESSGLDVEDVPAVCSNDASVGVAVAAQAHSGDVPTLTSVNNDVSAGYEASDSTTADPETLTSESERAVLAPIDGYPEAGASYERSTDTAASSASDDEAPASTALTEASAAPVTTDLYDAVPPDEGTTATAYEGTTATADKDTTVTAVEGTTVTVSEGTTATADADTTVTAAEGTTVTAYEGTTVTAAESTTVTAAESTTVTAYEGTTGTAAEGTTVTAAESSTVTACEGTTVTAAKGTTVTAAKGTTVTAAKGTTVTAAEGTTGTTDRASTALSMTKFDKAGVYSPSDYADIHAGSDKVLATGFRNGHAKRVRRFFSRMFNVCLTPNVEN